jgi:hypothetical protein
MTKDEIKDKIIELQDELIEHIKSNGIDSPFRSDELKYIRLFNSLATLKSQLSEAGEEKPIIKKCRQCRFFDLDEHCEPCESCYPIAYSNWQPR